MPIEQVREASHAPSLQGGVDRKPLDEKKLEKACLEFESIFIHQMLKSMRQTIPQTGLMGEGKERNIFQALFDEEVSKNITKRGGLGMGKMLYEQMRRRVKEAE